MCQFLGLSCRSSRLCFWIDRKWGHLRKSREPTRGQESTWGRTERRTGGTRVEEWGRERKGRARRPLDFRTDTRHHTPMRNAASSRLMEVSARSALWTPEPVTGLSVMLYRLMTANRDCSGRQLTAHKSRLTLYTKGQKYCTCRSSSGNLPCGYYCASCTTLRTFSLRFFSFTFLLIV